MLRRLLSLTLAITAMAVAAAAQCTIYGSPGGSGCGSSTPFGIPTIRCVGSPLLGNANFAIEATIPCTSISPLLVLGNCLPTPLRIQGPFGIGGFCGPTEASCLLFVGPTFFGNVPGSLSAPPLGYSFALPIPADPALRGSVVCAQMFSFCSLPGGACLAASHGLAVTVN